MSDSVETVTIDGASVEELGFFCCKSKPTSQGYREKLRWLQQCLADDHDISLRRRLEGADENWAGEFRKIDIAEL